MLIKHRTVLRSWFVSKTRLSLRLLSLFELRPYYDPYYRNIAHKILFPWPNTVPFSFDRAACRRRLPVLSLPWRTWTCPRFPETSTSETLISKCPASPHSEQHSRASNGADWPLKQPHVRRHAEAQQLILLHISPLVCIIYRLQLMHLYSNVKFDSVAPWGKYVLLCFLYLSQLLFFSFKRTLPAKCMPPPSSVTLSRCSVQSFNTPSLIRMDCWSHDFWLLGLKCTLISFCSVSTCWNRAIVWFTLYFSICQSLVCDIPVMCKEQ